MWRLICMGWFIVPSVAFIPGIPLRATQPWFFEIVSVVVAGYGMTQPILRRVSMLWGILLIGVFAVYCLHFEQIETRWLVWHVAPILTAGFIIAERGRSEWLKHSVIACAWIQIAAMIWQSISGVTFWSGGARNLVGTFGNRSMLAILLGLASLWTEGAQSILFCAASFLTGSISGAIIPALRLANGFVMAIGESLNSFECLE